MGDRAGEQVRMLAGCLVVGLAWSGGMLPAWHGVCIGVGGLTPSWIPGTHGGLAVAWLDWWAVTSWLVRDNMAAGWLLAVGAGWLAVVGSQ